MGRPENYYRFDVSELLAEAGKREFSPGELIKLPDGCYLPGDLFASIVSGNPDQGYMDVEGVLLYELFLTDCVEQYSLNPELYEASRKFLARAADVPIECQLADRRILTIQRTGRHCPTIRGVRDGAEVDTVAPDSIDGYIIGLPRKKPLFMTTTEDVGHELAHTFVSEETMDAITPEPIRDPDERHEWAEQWCEAFMRLWLAQPNVRERLYHFLLMREHEDRIILAPA